MSNVLSTFTVSQDGIEYLCADCDYGPIGSDIAIYAKRFDGKTWQHIGVFEDKKQPCAELFIFGLHGIYKLERFPVSLRKFKAITNQLGINEMSKKSKEQPQEPKFPAGTKVRHVCGGNQMVVANVCFDEECGAPYYCTWMTADYSKSVPEYRKCFGTFYEAELEKFNG